MTIIAALPEHRGNQTGRKRGKGGERKKFDALGLKKMSICFAIPSQSHVFGAASPHESSLMEQTRLFGIGWMERRRRRHDFVLKVASCT